MHGYQHSSKKSRAFFFISIITLEPSSFLRMNTIEVKPCSFHSSITREDLGQVKEVIRGWILGDIGYKRVCSSLILVPHPHCDFIVIDRYIYRKLKSWTIERIEILFDNSRYLNTTYCSYWDKGVTVTTTITLRQSFSFEDINRKLIAFLC